MPLTPHLKCTCDKCNREQIFESWNAAKASPWRVIRLDQLGGTTLFGQRNEPRPLQAVLCGDCAGGLDIKVAPEPELVEA